MKYDELIKKFGERALKNVYARDFTSYKTGGPVDLIVYPKNIDEVIYIFDYISKNNVEYFICGNATNILVSDEGFRGIFIKTDLLKNINLQDITVRVESGFLWDKFIEFSVNNSLSGLEKTSYIPGTVGGAVKMNAGAFAQETFDCLESIDIIDLELMKFKRLKKSDINFGYRKVENSDKWFICSAEFRFKYSDKKELINIREDIIRRRKEKQPLEYPSAGSVFKRPTNNYASKLIDECGLKRLRIGGAMVSEKHAGFIINYDNAKSSDIYRLIMKVKEEVFKKTGVELELEQVLVGKF